MSCVFGLAHRLEKYILAVNVYPLYLAHIYIYLYDQQYIQIFLLIFKQTLFVFVLFWVIIGSISYSCFRKKQINLSDALPQEHMNESFDVIEQQKEKESVTSNDLIDYCCEPVLEISPNISIDSPLENDKIFSKSPRELVCYCDGSYSHQSQIGYSGFRASNEFSKYRCCFPRRPRSGSTESEVFAACLALQYVAEYHYDTLILYTDCSKVKQLCEGPKRNDHNNYSTFIQVLNECREMNNQFDLRVEHVRGHSTWFEQQQCSIKREFAKVDRKVRRKRQQYERRYHFKKSYHRPLFNVLSLSIS